jgi:hypothetical protein
MDIFYYRPRIGRRVVLVALNKTLYSEINDDILTKQYFPRVHTEERRDLEIGLSSAVFGGKSGPLF